jgi:hypothetical protein
MDFVIILRDILLIMLVLVGLYRLTPNGDKNGKKSR